MHKPANRQGSAVIIAIVVAVVVAVAIIILIANRGEDAIEPTTEPTNGQAEQPENSEIPENPEGHVFRVIASDFQSSGNEQAASTTASIAVWNFGVEPIGIACTYGVLYIHDVGVIAINTYTAQPGNNEFSEILNGVDANANDLTVGCELDVETEASDA